MEWRRKKNTRRRSLALFNLDHHFPSSIPSLTPRRRALLSLPSTFQNQFDTMDLSDNAITRLDGFPRLPRVRTLLIHGNRVSAIGPNLAASLPSLTTLGLASNRLSRLADLDALGSFPRLAALVISGNPVSRHPQARPYLAWKCKGLRSLDGARVTAAEREAGEAAFGGEGGVAAAAEALGIRGARDCPAPGRGSAAAALN